MIGRFFRKFYLHIVIWTILLLLPFITYLYQPDKIADFKIYAAATHLVNILFLATNFYLLCYFVAPKFFFGHRKTFAAAIAMGDQGEVFSCDIHPHKKKLMESGAERLGLGCIEAAVQDAKVRRPAYEGAFDLVLADVPCSGLGIIRKKPDIRYKEPGPLEGLPAVQKAILDNVSAYVKPGGTLLYCTCTLLPRENGDIVEAFLTDHAEFELEPFLLPGPFGAVEEGQLTLWPHIHETDGFYLAKLRRRV